MSEVLRQRQRSGDGSPTVRSYVSTVASIDFGEGESAPIITLADGRTGLGACLGCRNARCMAKAAEEVEMPGEFESFPGDPSLEVCPTKALRWQDELGSVEVTADCIGCGLCVVRCPYGAMYLDGKAARVLIESRPGIVGTVSTKMSKQGTAKRKGCLGRSSAPALAALENSIPGLGDTTSLLLLRNVLHELGVQCRVRRRGDTNVRIDAVVAFEAGDVGVVEIELTGAVLESPRALLEDVAVLHGRYGIPVANIRPISLVLALPNARSEYYQVIEDIHRVLKIRCHTFTVGALFLMLWNLGGLSGLTDHLFTTNESGADLLGSIQKVLGRTLALNAEPYSGALCTVK
jgi:Fe-S-cluster-containing hydrogenase component 2